MGVRWIPLLDHERSFAISTTNEIRCLLESGGEMDVGVVDEDETVVV